MKVLVTGATGFLGKYIVKELVSHQYEVIATGRNQEVGETLVGERVTFRAADFTKLTSLDQAFAGEVDLVVHAGALSAVWGEPSEFYRHNVLGTENVLKMCRKYKVKRLVYISSPSIYADGRDQIAIKEYTPKKNRLTPYIWSKLLAEQKIKEYKEVDTVILRPRGLIGVGDTSVIPRVLKISRKIGIPVINGGEHLVDLTCVENVALAVRLALEVQQAGGQIYNITNGEPKPFREIMEIFLREMEIPIRLQRIPDKLLYALAFTVEKIHRIFSIYREPIFTRYTYYLLRYSQTLDIEKARRELGYRPIVSLREGIKKYAEDYRNSRVL